MSTMSREYATPCHPGSRSAREWTRVLPQTCDSTCSAPNVELDFGPPTLLFFSGALGSLRARPITSGYGPVAPAYRYARQQMSSVQAEHRSLHRPGATNEAQRKMLDVLREVLADDSVYPTISIDEDGIVIAEWRAGNASLEVECSSDGKMNFSLFGRDGREFSAGRSTNILRRVVRDMSDYVDASNPNWRSLFGPEARLPR